jgi:dipeptidyl aminopeptidase/acylaminoacyl peptidase
MLLLLAEGIEFVCVAYRGSSGYGLEHQDANRGEYGRADVWDIIAAGQDWKTRFGSNRPLIVTGSSYGGFLALLAMAQAGVPWAGGIVLWGVSGLHRLPAHQHRALPVDPEQQAAARLERSPLEQARYIRGPLLTFHGALDTVATTEEMRAVQNSVLAGGGDCELVVYEDDTHGLQRHRDDILARVQDFLERFR